MLLMFLKETNPDQKAEEVIVDTNIKTDELDSIPIYKDESGEVAAVTNSEEREMVSETKEETEVIETLPLKKYVRPLRIHPNPDIPYYDPFAMDDTPLPEEFFEEALVHTEMIYGGTRRMRLLDFSPIANSPEMTKDFREMLMF